jgi:hypothetical protein
MLARAVFGRGPEVDADGLDHGLGDQLLAAEDALGDDQPRRP